MELVRGGVLVVSTILIGLTAGYFFAYSNSVMRALRGVDDRAFVNVMQKINRDVQNPVFFLAFLGGVLFGIIALFMFLSQPAAVLLPVIVSLAFNFLMCFVVTVRGNVPMNVRLDRMGPPERIGDVAAVRREFEGAWTRLNHVRAWGSTLGFGAMVWALIAYVNT
ncbi:putative membrane protein [Kibdelosporangium banguiense]|uniref:Membrane protein n=1 Tax=Kibdelosporangium banguiense TaxID=1365924 RepID=A0ABS4TIU0_9PSEU|nr:anthrone oxygenase family protein [Kibdelosporangium banguiense]MBP2324346.1 putative membrane protein [Kibdelosporangium banguiense]